MADIVSFVKWNNTPDGLLAKSSYFTTKYFDLGTSSNKVKVLAFIANFIIEANTAVDVEVLYRTNTATSFTHYGFYTTNSSSDTRTEATITNHINDVKGIQFKVIMTSSGNTALNDFHFKYRKKRNFNVLDD